METHKIIGSVICVLETGVRVWVTESISICYILIELYILE